MAATLLFALTAWVFWPCVAGGFVWDDDFVVVGNRQLATFDAATLRWMFTGVHMGHYHPLTWVSLALDRQLWGSDPWGYHVTNVLLHAGNTVMVYALCRALGARASAGVSVGAAALATTLFALHPLRVESVAWVTERRGLLAAAASLLCVLAYLRGADPGRAARWWRGAALAAFALALLAKASSMALPAVLVVLDWYPLERVRRRGWARALGAKWPYAVLAGASAVQAMRAATASGAAVSPIDHGLLARVVQAAFGAGFYLRQAVWPDGLSPLYPLAGFQPGSPSVVVLAAVALAVTAALVAWRRSHPGWLAAWLAYAALLSPTLGLAQSGIQVAADRYTYLAMVPFVVLVAGGLARAAARDRRVGWIAATAVGLVALVLAARARAQIPVWRDPGALWGRVVALHPESPDGWHNRALARLGAGDPEGALADVDRAIALAPESPIAYNSRATVRQALGDVDGARADLDRAIALAPAWVDPYNNRGNVRLAAGDVAGAREDYDRALALAPEHVRARYNRALVRERQRDVAGALADMDAVVALVPDYAHAYAMRVRYRAALGDLAGALADSERALALLPAGSADARTVEGYRAELRTRGAPAPAPGGDQR